MIDPDGFSNFKSIYRLLTRILAGFLVMIVLVGCLPAYPVESPYDPAINLDAETQALIANARRTVFIIPFSHWDTDWHQTFADYSRLADRNIQAAINLAKERPGFRYTLEQVVFVKHFWENHPESRADLKALVQNRQLTFAWGGMTQPETSLAAPGVQWHNLLEGQNWIAEIFGQAYVPTGAWQSDAFGNSAALPFFLTKAGISHMFLGRWRQRCPAEDESCQSLPPTFYWTSPLPSYGAPESDRIMVASVPYSTAWGALFNKDGLDEKLTAFQTMIEEQFNRGASRYLFLPYGFDFLDPDPALMDLVESWNAGHKDTILVISDPETAFHYLSGEDLPDIRVDLNPLWQGFYGTRPYARIADKESEFYLTATDKFGQFLDPPVAGKWITATINAHYDNLSAVGYDQVWAESQRPRFESAVDGAAEQLMAVLALIAGSVFETNPESPALLCFNAVSWSRGGVIELHDPLPAALSSRLPEQRIDPQTAAVFVEPLPPIGYAPVEDQFVEVPHPAAIVEDGDLVTLSNGLVSVRLNAASGGTFDRLEISGDPAVDLLEGIGDDLVYIQDQGDVYGARFGEELARQSQAPARIEVMADGLLVARVQIAFSLGGQPVTKTVTIRADSPLIEVSVQMKALPDSSALIRTATIIQTDIRTDDLGFGAYQHPVDNRPIEPGDITYRRNIFYPVMYWSDVSSGDHGLSLITHGLQGIGGTGELNLLLVRSVSDPGDQAHEGVTDTETHTFLYAYYPHRGDAVQAQPWKQAYAFNQPIIPVWRSGSRLNIQLPFRDRPTALAFPPADMPLPETQTLATADRALIVDVSLQSGQLFELVVNYDPLEPGSRRTASGESELPRSWLSILKR